MMTEKYSLDELDRLASEKIMGWVLYKDEKDWVRQKCWHPTRDIAQAWQCLEKICAGDAAKRATQFHVSVGLTSCNLERKVFIAGPEEDEYFVEAETASEAITKACLKAKGVEL